MIFETIVITVNSLNQPHVAPFGVRFENDLVIISPYKPSTTLENILATKTATLNMTDDVRVFAGALTEHINEVALQPQGLSLQNIPAEAGYSYVKPNIYAGYRLVNALSHVELALIDVKDDDVRPQLIMQKVRAENHAPFLGFNRAQVAVVELCILVSRLHMLPREKVETELAYLQIAIDKTAGERELEAWGWLQEKIADFYVTNKV
jgi:uncharacterized protein